MKQLSLFEDNTHQSFQFGDKVRKVVIEGVTYFSILDVFQHFGSAGSAGDPRKYWQRAKSRLEKQSGHTVTGLSQYQFEALDGRKKMSTPIGTVKFFMRLVQVVEIQEWEHLRTWMAELAEERIEEEANPELILNRSHKRYVEAQVNRGASEEQARAMLVERIEGVDTFKELMANVQRVCVEKPEYWNVVNAEYQALFRQTTDGLKLILNTKSIRDALPQLQLQYLKTAEAGLNAILQQQSRLTNQQILSATRAICVPLGEHLQGICRMLGIDPVTGQTLLTDGRQGG